MKVLENIKQSSEILADYRNEMDDNKYLTFILNGETFAICIQSIKEIIEYFDVTSIPMIPDSVLGVVNLRGSVVPIIDLSSIFGRGKTIINYRSCIVIAEIASENNHAHDIGIVVDAVNEVLDIPHSDIQAAPSLGNRIKTDYLDGIATIKDHFVPIINICKVIPSTEMDVLKNIAVENS